MLSLFCTGQFSIDAGGSDTPGSDIKINNDFLIDTTFAKDLKDKVLFEVPRDAYDAAIESINQVIDGEQGGHTDTIVQFPYPERAHVDINYVQQLIEAGFIDAEFAHDVLLVDLTRPVFSADRCELLEFAPDLDGSATPDEVRDGFIANLSGEDADSPAGQLLANLEEEDTDHAGAVDTYIDACKARDRTEFINDAVQVAQARRNASRTMDVVEFAPVLPKSNTITSLDLAFDPLTCELQ